MILAEVEGFLDLIEFRVGNFVSVSFAGFEEVEDCAIRDFGEFGLEGSEESQNALGDFLFQVAVMSFAGPSRDDVLKREAGDDGFDLEEVADARLVEHIKLDFADAVGRRRHDFFLDSGRVVGKHDFAVLGGSGFTHFFLWVLEVADADAFGEVHEFDLVFRLGGEGEDFAEAVVEALGETAGELEMLELVLADRDVDGVVEEDVGGHEDGVVEDADVDAVFAFAFVFVLGHAVQFAHTGDAIKNPAEFGVGRDAGLAVEVDVRRELEAGGEVVFQGFDEVLL